MPITNLYKKYGSKYKVVDDGTNDPCPLTPTETIPVVPS